MHSFCSLSFAVFALSFAVSTEQHLNPRFYNPPRPDTESPSSITPTSTTIGPSTSSALTGDLFASPSGEIACVPPIENFIVTHAEISACPRCSPDDSASPINETAPGRQNSTQAVMETFKFVLRNPTTESADISCHLTWDTSLASPDKYPVAKQMYCDQNSINQINAVLEKQASGITAGFYLFVWNNNQMETMVAWMVGNITPTKIKGEGWKNDTIDIHERIYHEGHINLNSMPTMLLSDWLQITANSTD